MKQFAAALCLSLLVTASSTKLTPGGTAIQFDLQNPGQEAALTQIFNLQGQTVAVLTAQSLGHFFWDGTNVDQEPVDSGMYVVQIRHHGEVWHSPILVNR